MKLFFAALGVFAATTATTAVLPQPKTTEFAPLDYFEDNCSRCHGSLGSFYGENFGQGLSDEQLKTVVQEMADGPAQAPLEAKDLEVLVAWHRALRDKKPFVVVTKSEKTATGWKLRGEVSPTAKLTHDGAPVEVKGYQWLSETTENAPLEFKVQAGETTVEFSARQGSFAPQ